MTSPQGVDGPADVNADQTGDARAWSLSVESIETTDGTLIKLPPVGVTVFVGGNNAGKSTMLREIVGLLARTKTSPPPPLLAIKSLRLKKEGSGSDLVGWLTEHLFSAEGELGQRIFARAGQSLQASGAVLASEWDQGSDNPALGVLFGFMVHNPDIGSRMGVAAVSTPQRSDPANPPPHIINYFEDNRDLFERFSDLSKRIFRQPLTLDFLAGQIQIRVGKLDVPSPQIDRVTREYKDAMRALPSLESQGDGMRSLLGLLLPIVTASYPIVVIDEPETFLHPPQAFELGKTLATVARASGVQVIAATHDRNFLIGLLDPGVPVSVVHLDRSSGVARASQLSSDLLRETWDDPVLRYSNVLDGLFCRLVVIAEAESDCRFYSAALDVADQTEALEVAPSEVLFVPANGKAGMAKIAQIFTGLGVRVIASPDLDILNAAATLAILVTAMGGDWVNFKRDYDSATEPFRQPRTPATCADVLEAVTSVLKDHLEESYDEEHKRKVRAQIRSGGSPWDALKDYGMAAFKTSASRAAAGRLLTALHELGIRVVRVGELERFAPELEVSKGPRWLPAALEAGAHQGAEAQEHVRTLVQL